MKENRGHGSNFEEKLLDELKAVVAERGAAQAASEAKLAEAAAPAWRHGRRLALGGGAALAAVAAVLAFNSGGDNTPKAFAVEPQDGGGVTIKVFSLNEASGLEQALENAGIQAQVTWLPAGMACREPRYTPSIVHLPGGGTLGGLRMAGPSSSLMTFGVGSTQRWRERTNEHMRGVMSGEIPADEHDESIPNMNLDPEAFRPDQSVVLSGSPRPYEGDPEGGFEALLAVAEGPVEPCEPVPAPTGGILRDMQAAEREPTTPRGGDEATASGAADSNPSSGAE